MTEEKKMDSDALLELLMTNDVIFALKDNNEEGVEVTHLCSSESLNTKVEAISIGVLDLLENNLAALLKRGQEITKVFGGSIADNIIPFKNIH